MKNSYNKLNKKGRFWFWWFASCNLAILVFLVIMSFLTYTILRLVAYLDNVGG